MYPKLRAAPLVAASLLLLAVPAIAAETDLEARVAQQASQIAQLEARLAQLEALLQSQQQEGGQVAGSPAAAAPPAAASDAAEAPVITWRGAPQIASADGSNTFKLRGRVLAEAGGVASDNAGIDYPSGMEMRAMRLGVEGRIGSKVSYRGEVDFAGDSVTIKDAWLRLPVAGGSLTLGNQKPPFSLENLTGLPNVTFLERAAPNVFAFSETLGATYARSERRWTAALGVFGETAGVSRDGDEALGVAARASAVALEFDGGLVHLGAASYYRRLGRDAGDGFRVRQRPESRIFATRLVDTGAADAASSAAAGVEFAGLWGSWSVQGELMRNYVDYYTLPNATYDGAYLYASWFATGEQRAYSRSSGSFGRVRPSRAIDDGGWGAFELALRYSMLDLDNGSLRGGRQDNWTLGLNWHPTQFSRITANWVYFDVSDSFAREPLGAPAHEGHAFGIRAQVDW